jgi:rare lipoprotein A
VMSCESASARFPGIATAIFAGCIATAAMVAGPPAGAQDLKHSHATELPRHQHQHPHQHSVTTRASRSESPARRKPSTATVAPPKPKPDFTGKQRLGIASFYADNFGGKPMADGAPMNLDGNNAASRTLPLGTKAKVTNLETGKSATVVIEDRGPYVDGRIVDLSPATARKIGISRRQGLSKVVVAPITVPQPDGTVKLGAAARATGPVREASLETGARSR